MRPELFQEDADQRCGTERLKPVMWCVGRLCDPKEQDVLEIFKVNLLALRSPWAIEVDGQLLPTVGVAEYSQEGTLPGCISQGESKEDAVTNIREAIEGYILALKEDGLSVPEERFDTLVLAV